MNKKQNIFKRILILFCGPGKARVLRTSIFAVLLSLILGGLIIIISRKKSI